MKRQNLNLGSFSVAVSLLFGMGFWVVMFSIYGFLQPASYPGRFALRFIFFTSFFMCFLGVVIALVGLMSKKYEKSHTGKGFILNSFFLAIMSFLLAVFALSRKPWDRVATASGFDDVTKVEFSMHNFNEAPTKFNVVDPAKIKELTNWIRIVPIAPTKHQPFSKAVFVKDNEKIVLLFTSLCFDIQYPGEANKHCKMPPKLYELIKLHETGGR